MKNITIKGTGKAIPENIVTAEMIDKKLNLEKGKTFKVTGLETRHFLENDSASELILEAVNQALDNAKINYSEASLRSFLGTTLSELSKDLSLS